MNSGVLAKISVAGYWSLTPSDEHSLKTEDRFRAEAEAVAQRIAPVVAASKEMTPSETRRLRLEFTSKLYVGRRIRRRSRRYLVDVGARNETGQSFLCLRIEDTGGRGAYTEVAEDVGGLSIGLGDDARRLRPLPRGV
jgi:hypothetical protein